MQIEDENEDRRQWILRSCDRYGVSRTELAHRAGISPSTITRFLKGGPISLSGRTLQRLRSAVAALSPAQSEDTPSYQPLHSQMLETRSALQARPTRPKVPLLKFELSAHDAGRPEGCEDLEMIRGDVGQQETGSAHGNTVRSSRIFAFYMPGDFMRPRFRTGECVLVDRLRPASTGSEVLIEFVTRSGQSNVATVAELVERDRNQIRLRQFQHQTLATIHRSQIENIFAIVGFMRNDVMEANLNLDLGGLR